MPIFRAASIGGSGDAGRNRHQQLAALAAVGTLLCIVTFVPFRSSPEAVHAIKPPPEIPIASLSRSLQQNLKSICGSEPPADGHTILVTGAAGFIGFHTALALKQHGAVVVGYDNFNDYYPVSLKRSRQKLLLEHGITIVEGDLNNNAMLLDVFSMCRFTHVVHLAAQAGVRYAARNPQSYVHSNVAGTVSLLEAMKAQHVRPRLIYASSSSVYGLNTKTPFSEEDRVDTPASLYAATKRSGELLTEVYYNLYGISCTGLRFFTVYGPYGRPDMSYMAFTRYILEGRPIRIFQGPNNAELARDFTFVNDTVAGIVGAVDVTPPSTKGEAWWRLFNLGNTHPVTVTNFVKVLAEKLGKQPQIKYTPLPALGDVLFTHANVSAAAAAFDYKPKTQLGDGLKAFVDWYLDYYGPDGTRQRADEKGYKPD